MKHQFVKTENYRRFMAAVALVENRASIERCILPVVGDPGVGKTRTVDNWGSATDAVFLEGMPGMSPRYLRDALKAETGIRANGKFAEDVAFVDFFRNDGKPRGIILDECQHGFYSGALRTTAAIASSYEDNTTTGPAPDYFVTGNYFYTYTPVYTNTADEYSYRSVKIERVFAVAYKKTGERSVFAYRNRTDLYFPGLDVVSVNGHKTVYWDGTTTIFYSTSETPLPTMNVRKISITTKALDLLIDSVAVITFKQDTDNTKYSVQTCNPGPVNDLTTGGSTVYGDAQLASGVWLWDEGSTRIQMLTPNSFGIMADVSSAWKIYAWASADFSGKPGVLTPDQLTGKKFSYDPESGQYNRRIIKWF